MRSIRALAASAAAIALAAGCSFNGTGVGPENQPDAGADVVEDAAVTDAPRNVPPDAPPDVEPDANPELPPDAEPVGSSCETDRALGLLCVPFADITADGDFSDWSEIPEQAFAIDDGAGFYIVDDDLFDDYSPSATLTFSVAHDRDFLYFKLVVEDDVTVGSNGSESFEDDGIELFFDVANDTANVPDFAIVFNLPASWSNYGEQGLSSFDVNAHIVGEGDFYAIEASIAKSALTIDSAATEVKFEISLIDEDIAAGPYGFSSWHIGASSCPGCCGGFQPAPQPWCDESAYSTLKLLP